MVESYPSDAALDALSGTSDAGQGVLYPTTNEEPWQTSAYKMQYRLLDAARRAGDLRVYKDGTLTFGVRAGLYLNGDTPVAYAGASAQALTDANTNYIYLTAAGVLTVNTTGFPVPSVTPHIPLATIVCSGGTYAHSNITDYRGRAILSPYAITRARLAQEDLAVYPVGVGDCRNPNGTPVDTTGGVGLFSFLSDADEWKFKGETANMITVTDLMRVAFQLPPEYVAAQTVKVRLRARVAGAGTPGTKTIDMTAKELADGGFGADICATAIQTLTTSWANYDFELTATGLVAGDWVLVELTAVLQETVASNLNVEMTLPVFLADIKG